MRLLPLLLLVVTAACPKRKEPERGVELVFSKKGDVRPVVERRLAQAGIVARLDESADELSVRLPGAEPAQVAEVRELLAMTARLEFCPEAKEERGRLCDVDAGVTVVPDEARASECVLTAPTAEALLRALPVALDGGGLFVGRVSPGDETQRTFAVELSSCMTPRLLEAEPKEDRDTGQPMLALLFDPKSGAQFGELTGKMVRRRLLIVLDGRVQSAPVVMEAITGGRSVLTFGHGMKKEEMARLGRALAGGPLPAPMTLVKERDYGPPSLLK